MRHARGAAAPVAGSGALFAVASVSKITALSGWRTQPVANGLPLQTDSAVLEAWWNVATG
jgi:hypothetical protein